MSTEDEINDLAVQIHNQAIEAAAKMAELCINNNRVLDIPDSIRGLKQFEEESVPQSIGEIESVMQEDGEDAIEILPDGTAKKKDV